MRDRVGVLETAVDNSVDDDSPPGCAKMLRGSMHLDVLRRALVGGPLAHNELVVVRLHSGAKTAQAKPPSERNRLPWYAAQSFPGCRSVVATRLSSRWPGKGRRRRTAPGSRGHACLMTCGRVAKRAQGAAAYDGSEAGIRTAASAAFVIISWLGGDPEF